MDSLVAGSSILWVLSVGTYILPGLAPSVGRADGEPGMSSGSKVEMSAGGRFQDEFEATLNEASRDPAFRAAYEDALERHSILDRLIGLRRARHLSQAAVADRMGVRQPTVSGFETEDSDPRLSTLQRYARAVEARLRLVLTVPAHCDWVSPSTFAYSSASLTGTRSASAKEGNLAEAWKAEAQAEQRRDRWAASA
jgi:transcriptional regulator with XRE-family HTH domain